MLPLYATECPNNEGKGVATNVGHDANSPGDQQAGNASAGIVSIFRIISNLPYTYRP